MTEANTDTSPLRWLIRLILLVLLAEAIWRFYILFLPGVESGLSGYLLSGISIALAALLLFGEKFLSLEGLHRFALQLIAVNMFIFCMVLIFLLKGPFIVEALVVPIIRLGLSFAVWAFYKRGLNATVPPSEAA